MAGIDEKYEAVVIGTSAGGLHALSEIFEFIPANYPLPIIVVQHRSKDHRDLLEEVLQEKCRMLIKQADEKEKIVTGYIYIAPPDYHLLVEEDRTFSLSADRHVSYSRPSIDVLFESAATVYQNKLIGIILTGANNDGAEGIAAVKKNGGVTIAQNPGEALFPYMPRAAIEKGAAQSLNLKEIGNFLLSVIK